MLQTDAPDPAKIPATDLLGVTVVLVTCSYKAQEFIRVGYYVNNAYGEALPEGELHSCAQPGSLPPLRRQRACFVS